MIQMKVTAKTVQNGDLVT